jgi:hypothetical protein
MLKKFINFPFSHSLRRVIAYPAQFKLALGTGSQSFLVNFKPYEIKPEAPVVDPEEQPGFYNVYDEDEFPEGSPSHYELPEEEDSKEPPERKRSPEPDEQKKPFRNYQNEQKDM